MLDGTYREVASRLPDNAHITFEDAGQLHFAVNVRSGRSRHVEPVPS